LKGDDASLEAAVVRIVLIVSSDILVAQRFLSLLPLDRLEAVASERPLQLRASYVQLIDQLKECPEGRQPLPQPPYTSLAPPKAAPLALSCPPSSLNSNTPRVPALRSQTGKALLQTSYAAATTNGVCILPTKSLNRRSSTPELTNISAVLRLQPSKGIYSGYSGVPPLNTGDGVSTSQATPEGAFMPQVHRLFGQQLCVSQGPQGHVTRPHAEASAGSPHEGGQMGGFAAEGSALSLPDMESSMMYGALSRLPRTTVRCRSNCHISQQMLQSETARICMQRPCLFMPS
jgi:hypothetical protein